MKENLKFPLLTVFIIFSTMLTFGQQKKYKVAVIGFYNLENFFDTLDDPKIKDEEFLPTGSYHYTSDVYKDKVRHLATVISQIGTEFTSDGLAMMGCAEVENEGV